MKNTNNYEQIFRARYGTEREMNAGLHNNGGEYYNIISISIYYVEKTDNYEVVIDSSSEFDDEKTVIKTESIASAMDVVTAELKSAEEYVIEAW